MSASGKSTRRPRPTAPLGPSKAHWRRCARSSRPCCLERNSNYPAPGFDTLGHEVRKELQWDAEIPNAMIRILESMSAEDRIRVGSAADAKGSLAEKIQWVRDEADAYCLEGLSGLGRVLELMGADVDETSED